MSCSRDLNAVSSSAAVLQKLSSSLEALKRKFVTSAMSPPDKTALKHPALVQEETFVRFGLLQGRAQSVAQEECIADLGIDPNVRSRAGRLGNGHATVLDGKLGDPSLHSRPDVLVVQR